MRRDRAYLKHILDAISNIEKFVEGLKRKKSYTFVSKSNLKRLLECYPWFPYRVNPEKLKEIYDEANFKVLTKENYFKLRN